MRSVADKVIWEPKAAITHLPDWGRRWNMYCAGRDQQFLGPLLSRHDHELFARNVLKEQLGIKP